jgi:hypothetical protein
MNNHDGSDARTVRPGHSVTYNPPMPPDDQLRMSSEKLAESIKHDQAIKPPPQPTIDQDAFSKMEGRLSSLRLELRARGPQISDREGLSKLVEYTNIRCQLALAKAIELVAGEFGTTPDFLVRLPSVLAMQGDLQLKKPALEQRVEKLEAALDEVLRTVRAMTSSAT